MVFIQKNPPPPNKVISFSLQDFSGGLNNRSEQLNINEASDLLNMAFSDNTLMSRRHGIVLHDEHTISEPITYMDVYDPYNDGIKRIVASDKELYVDGVKLCDVSGKIRGTNFMGMYMFVDGNKIRVYGKFPQATVAPYVKVTGTAVNEYVLMELVNPPEGFTPLGTEHKEGVYNYDYTNKKVWYEPCKHEVEDAFKGSNVIPEKPKYICLHADRLYISGAEKDDDNVFITEVSNGFYFPVYLPIQLPPNSDKVKGLLVFHDAVVVGRHNDVHVIYGNTNRTDIDGELFKLRKINTHAGFASQEAISLAHNYMLYLGSDGNMYAMHTTQTNVEFLTTQILNQNLDIFKKPVNLTLEDLPRASACFHKDFWYITMDDKVLVYSYRHRAWTLYNHINARSFTIEDDVMLMGTEAGQIVKFSETDFLDLDQPYEAIWKSKWLDMGDPSMYKNFREFFIVAHTFPSRKSEIDVRFEVDYTDVTDRYTVKSEIAIFGRAKWGDRFINRDIIQSLPFVIGRRGRGVRVVVSCGEFPQEKPIERIEDLTYYPGLRHGLLVWVNEANQYYLYTVEDGWQPQELIDLNLAMKVYQINGDYELRGKR